MDNGSRITLGLLNAVDETEQLTQRNVANDLGIALGLANTYLKRCVNKGFVKVRQIPRNRFAYYLTPVGFAEKSRLTGEYLSQSFNLFRQARLQYSTIFDICGDRGWNTVALWGAGDLAEIAMLFGSSDDVSVTAIIEPNGISLPALEDNSLVPIVENTDACSTQPDGIIITCLKDPQGAYAAAVAVVGYNRVLAPNFLHISDPRNHGDTK